MTQTVQAITLEILVRNEDNSGVYNLIEVWRSTVSEAGPFEELTAESWKPARVPSSASDPPSAPITGPSVNAVGRQLSFIVQNADLSGQLSIIFSGSDPLTLANIANQISNFSFGKLRAYVASGPTLVVETVAIGAASYLEILESDTASILGLPTQKPDSAGFGKEARIALVAGQSTYSFLDPAGSPDFFYKTRFRDRNTGAVSEFSAAFSGQQAAGLGTNALVVGYLNLVSNDGKPLAYREVSVHANFDATTSGGKIVAGNDMVQSTDQAGHVEFTLVRGKKYTVAISGTNIVKDVTAPLDQAVSSFMLADPNFSDQSDYFRARVPEIPVLERRSF